MSTTTTTAGEPLAVPPSPGRSPGPLDHRRPRLAGLALGLAGLVALAVALGAPVARPPAPAESATTTTTPARAPANGPRHR